MCANIFKVIIIIREHNKPHDCRSVKKIFLFFVKQSPQTLVI